MTCTSPSFAASTPSSRPQNVMPTSNIPLVPARGDTTDLWNILGYQVPFDQRDLELQMPSGGVNRERIAIRTTKTALLDALMPYQCTRDHDHVKLEGSEKGIGSRTRYAENCPSAWLRSAPTVFKEERWTTNSRPNWSRWMPLMPLSKPTHPLWKWGLSQNG